MKNMLCLPWKHFKMMNISKADDGDYYFKNYKIKRFMHKPHFYVCTFFQPDAHYFINDLVR